MTVSRVLRSALAAPFFAVGFACTAIITAALWVAAAYMIGAEAARERWKRAS